MTSEFRSKSKYALTIGLLIAVLVPLYLAWLLARQAKQADQAYRWVEHTHSVLELLDNLQSTVRLAESEQRAFLLTRKQTAAERYRAARDEAPERMDALARLLKDNPAQNDRAIRLRKILSERLAMLQANITLVPSSESPEVAERLATSAAKSAELEVVMAQMAAAERSLLAQRRAEYSDLRDSLEVGALAATGVGSALLVLVSFVLRREHRSRRAYEQRIAEARDAALSAVDTTAAFVASVSHEIRTPMNGIIGSADLLLHDPSLTPAQRAGVETIETSGRALLALLNDILDLSKVQAGEMAFSKEDFSVSEVVEEVMELFAPSAARKGIELVNTLAADVPAEVQGDRLRLRQVLANLVSNAVKFTEKGGVAVRILRRRELELGEKICLRFEVCDTGPGISPEDQQKLFKPFSQVDAKVAQRHGGTGLGLAICKELVQRMNGRLDVESAVNEGSTFWFTAIFDPARNNFRASPASLPKERVVVIEARPLTADALSAHLTAWGMQPVHYERPDLVPTSDPEVEAPGIAAVILGTANGAVASAVAEVKKRPWLAERSLFLLTEGSVSAAELRTTGATAGLSYPFRPSELYDRLSGRRTTVSNYAPASVRFHPASVIVADDNPINRQVMVNQLRHLGLEAVLCCDGREAVTLARQQSGEIILMDCQMPEMDGFEASRVIRNWETEDQRPRIPIVAVTANVMAGDAEQCLRAGMDGYLPKPVDVKSLQEVLCRFLPHDPLEETAEVASTEGQGNADLDEAQLQLSLSGDAELDRELVREALVQAELQVNLLKTAFETGDEESWITASHRGRGSCAQMGFKKLGDAFQVAEMEAKSPAERRAVLDQIGTNLTTVRSTLLARGWQIQAPPDPRPSP